LSVNRDRRAQHEAESQNEGPPTIRFEPRHETLSSSLVEQANNVANVERVALETNSGSEGGLKPDTG
jgi:hypothetical protein